MASVTTAEGGPIGACIAGDHSCVVAVNAVTGTAVGVLGMANTVFGCALGQCSASCPTSGDSGKTN